MGAQALLERNVTRLFKFTGKTKQVDHGQRLIERIATRRSVALRQFNALEQGLRREIENDIEFRLPAASSRFPIEAVSTEMPAQGNACGRLDGKAARFCRIEILRQASRHQHGDGALCSETFGPACSNLVITDNGQTPRSKHAQRRHRLR